MRRRNLLLATLAQWAISIFGGSTARAQNANLTDAQKQMIEEYKRRALEAAAKARAAFPYPLIEVDGANALKKWQELKSTAQGTPVILGGEHFENLFGAFTVFPARDGFPEHRPRPVEDILRDAEKIRFPDDLISKRKKDEAEAGERLRQSFAADPNMPVPQIMTLSPDGTSRTLSREETLATIFAERHEPPEGDWPRQASPSPGLSVVMDTLSGKPLSTVYLTVLPTEDWTTIPAYMNWGDWNENPSPEYHVAALRSWRDRYGAELAALSFDVLNLRVTRKPQSREEALALAREHYAYCNDIVDQGVETLNHLAKDLMENDWWYFWWD